MYERLIKKHVENWMFKGKTLIIYGARQVGKTTLAEEIIASYGNQARYIDCDLASNAQALSVQEPNLLKEFIGNYKVVVIDEAQRVKNIGINLKILHKYFPETQIIATGSSSFDLANEVSEPMTGRAIEFLLQPLSIQEINQKYDPLALQSRVESVMRFGTYPAVFDQPEEVATKALITISQNYLYKDILSFQKIKKSNIVFKLLQLLALQVGQEVSLNEIGQKLQISHLTVEKYLDILEKTFVVFTLRAFKRNLRDEIGKPFKVYFWDLGIRNSLINNFNPMNLRNDVGALWENFCIAEKLKSNGIKNLPIAIFGEQMIKKRLTSFKNWEEN
jgi:predicted AAA+ superfamily ATPase